MLSIKSELFIRVCTYVLRIVCIISHINGNNNNKKLCEHKYNLPLILSHSLFRRSIQSTHVNSWNICSGMMEKREWKIRMNVNDLTELYERCLPLHTTIILFHISLDLCIYVFCGVCVVDAAADVAAVFVYEHWNLFVKNIPCLFLIFTLSSLDSNWLHTHTLSKRTRMRKRKRKTVAV